jgi:hypothetical protein
LDTSLLIMRGAVSLAMVTVAVTPTDGVQLTITPWSQFADVTASAFSGAQFRLDRGQSCEIDVATEQPITVRLVSVRNGKANLQVTVPNDDYQFHGDGIG